MNASEELTICSVSFESRPFLESNLLLTRALNPGLDISWLVAENSPNGSANRLEGNPGFRVIDGVERPHDVLAPASCHHAFALNKLVTEAPSRFLLILDPDFYILQSGWITTLLKHMQSHELAFFGAPWNPTWIRKYRYFPCAHCLLIDTTRVDRPLLDFTPWFEGRDPSKDWKSLPKGTPKKLLHAPMNLLGLWQDRQQVTAVPDVGYRLFERYGGSSDVECLTPVFDPKEDIKSSIRRFTSIDAWIERFLPEELCLLPKKEGYFSRKSFVNFDFPDLKKLGWEEFLWQDRPFGVHIRSFPKSGAQREFHLKQLASLINMYC